MTCEDRACASRDSPEYQKTRRPIQYYTRSEAPSAISENNLSNAPDSDRALALQLLLVPVLLFLLAVLQPGAVMRLEHAVLAAEMTLAKPTVANDALRGVFAVLEAASDLLGCAAAERERNV